jgi:hypothetical protein
MKRIWLRIFIAVFTFIIGVSSSYLLWLIYSQPAEIPPVNSQIEMPQPRPKTIASYQANPAQEEWEQLAALGGCTLGLRYYSPQFDSYDPEQGVNDEAGIFYGTRWVAFFRRDKHQTVSFLVSQIPNKSITNVHIDPFGPATKGELAVYCLQYILKVNWYELKQEYQARFDKIDYEYSSDQDLLQRMIRTKRGAQEMMDLWQQVYEHAS